MKIIRQILSLCILLLFSLLSSTAFASTPVASAYEQDRAALIGDSVGYLFSGGKAENVSNASSIASSGIINNYLTHAEWNIYRGALDSCDGEEECERAVHAWAERTALTNHEAFLSCGHDRACVKRHADLIEYTGGYDIASDLVRKLHNLDYYRSREMIRSNVANTRGVEYLAFKATHCGPASGIECAAAYEASLEIQRAGVQQTTFGAIGVVGTGAGMLLTGCGGIIGCIVLGAGGVMSADQLETGIDNMYSTGELEHSNYIQILKASGASQEQAEIIEFWTGIAVMSGDFAVLSVGVLRSVGKSSYTLPNNILDDFATPGGGVAKSVELPQGYRVLNDGIGASRVAPPNGYRWVTDDGTPQLQSTTSGRIYASVDDVPADVPYFRVQGGGSGTAVSRDALTVNPDGSVSITPGCKGAICVSAGSPDHAAYYISERRPDGNVVVFEVDQATHNQIMETAVDQRNNAGAPVQIVDRTTSGNAVSLQLDQVHSQLMTNGASKGRVLTQQEFLDEFGGN